MSDPIRILYLTDVAETRDLVQEALSDRNGAFEIVEATSPDAANPLRAGDFDLVLCEAHLLSTHGRALLARSGTDVPVIATGTGTAVVAVEALKLGAADFVDALNIRRLPAAIEAALHDRALRVERLRARQELQLSERNLSAAQRIAHVGSWSYDLERNTLLWSEELYRIYQQERETYQPSLESLFELTHPEDAQRFEAAVRDAMARREPWDILYRIVRPDGSVRELHAQGGGYRRHTTRDRPGNLHLP